MKKKELNMLKIVKRKSLSKKEHVLIQSSAIIFALLFAGLFIMMTGNNPINVYLSMLDGAFGNGFRAKETIINAIPLIITSLGIIIAFKMKFWNIGACLTPFFSFTSSIFNGRIKYG